MDQTVLTHGDRLMLKMIGDCKLVHFNISAAVVASTNTKTVEVFERLSKQGLIQRDDKWRWTATNAGREALKRRG
jgi:hypothetical protein